MMNRTIKTILLLLLCAKPSFAQEYSFWTFDPLESNSLKIGSEAPIDVTITQSEKTIVYSYSNMKLPHGDFIYKLSFRGYNPGKEISRHLKIWMRNDESMSERDIRTADVSKMTCVFDGNCTIPVGGSSEKHISLLDIPLDNPFLYTQESYFVLKIECSGEAVEDPVYFETHEEQYMNRPVAVITVQSPVVYYSGKVMNQDEEPVENAHVRFYNNDLEYTAITNKTGCFKARIERGNNRYYSNITADSYADYIEDRYTFCTEGEDTALINFVLYDAIRFKKDEPATIILPVKPDPMLGRFYRLTHYDTEPTGESHYYFEREDTPHANVPYVVFPNYNFEIHPGDYETKGVEPGRVSVTHPRDGGASLIFQGSYQNRTIYYGLESESLYFVCMTPDCSYAKTDWGYSSKLGRIGAFRACFLINGVWHGIYNAPYSFIFNGEQTDIVSVPVPLSTTATAPLFDLQGRRIQGEQQRKGVYIRGGRKYVWP